MPVSLKEQSKAIPFAIVLMKIPSISSIFILKKFQQSYLKESLVVNCVKTYNILTINYQLSTNT